MVIIKHIGQFFSIFNKGGSIENLKLSADVNTDKLVKVEACRKVILKYIRDNPVACGSVLTVGGAVAALSGPLIISVGVAVCTVGESVIAIASYVAGIGTMLGVVNKSGNTVRQSLYGAGIIGFAGFGLYLSGSLLKLSGYVMLIGGSALSLIGLGILGNGLCRLRTSQKQNSQAIGSAVNKAVENLKRQNKQYDDTDPVYIVDLKQKGEDR